MSYDKPELSQAMPEKRTAAKSAKERRRSQHLREALRTFASLRFTPGLLGRTAFGSRETKRPRKLCSFRGQFVGVGVRHTLFPGGTRLDALAFAGGVLPDATLRGMRMFRSHGGTVLTVADRDLSSEASAPGSDAPCRERRAGRGADTPATFTFSRRHPYHGDGISFWPIVGPALRV